MRIHAASFLSGSDILDAARILDFRVTASLFCILTSPFLQRLLRENEKSTLSRKEASADQSMVNSE